MLIHSPDREAEIAGLNLPQTVLKLTRGEFVHRMLSDDCRELKLLWELDVSPNDLTVVPLWEGHSYVTGFAKETSQYIKFDFYRPQAYEVLGASIRAVIADLLIWYWTEEEAEDGALRQIARILEFPEIDRLLQEIKAANEGTAESQREWEAGFRQSLA